MPIEDKLNQAYHHVKPYLNDLTDPVVKVLHRMCSHCDRYCGEEHDFDECWNTPCFNCWLALEYLDWESSWEQDNEV